MKHQRVLLPTHTSLPPSSLGWDASPSCMVTPSPSSGMSPVPFYTWTMSKLFCSKMITRIIARTLTDCNTNSLYFTPQGEDRVRHRGANSLVKETTRQQRSKPDLQIGRPNHSTGHHAFASLSTRPRLFKR